MELNTQQIELLRTIQSNLRRGDIAIISNKTGFSRVWVSRVLSPISEDYNEDIVAEAVGLIESRKQDTKNLLKKIA